MSRLCLGRKAMMTVLTVPSSSGLASSTMASLHSCCPTAFWYRTWPISPGRRFLTAVRHFGRATMSGNTASFHLDRHASTILACWLHILASTLSWSRSREKSRALEAASKDRPALPNSTSLGASAWYSPSAATEGQGARI